MAIRIPKNRSDQDMLVNWKEKPTFETDFTHEVPVKSTSQPTQKESFFTTELQEKVSKALLEVKIKLFQEGIVDYDIKVSREENRVILTAHPADKTKKSARKERS